HGRTGEGIDGRGAPIASTLIVVTIHAVLRVLRRCPIILAAARDDVKSIVVSNVIEFGVLDGPTDRGPGLIAGRGAAGVGALVDAAVAAGEQDASECENEAP